MNEDRANPKAARPSPLVELELAILSSDPAPEPVGARSDQGARRVLVVAADADMRAYVAGGLAGRSDLHVLTAASAADALVTAGDRDPDLVIVVNGAAGSDLFPEVPAIRSRSGDPAHFHARELTEQVDRLLAIGPHDSEELS